MTGAAQHGQAGGFVTVAVTSGKGGVGKTSVVVNLAVALARLRKRVAILDADFGLGNVDVLLGLAPTWHIGHVLAGEKTLGDIIVEGPLGVAIIPASSGLKQLTALTPAHWARLASALASVRGSFDYLLIDTAAGISSNVVDMLDAAERVIVVTSLEPTAIVDAYAVIKLLTSSDAGKELGLLVNGARDAGEADLVYRQLDIASTRFLQRRLRYFGYVTHDPSVREAVLMQRPVVDHLPQSAASRCFRILASRLVGLSPVTGGEHAPLTGRLLAWPAHSEPEAPQCA